VENSTVDNGTVESGTVKNNTTESTPLIAATANHTREITASTESNSSTDLQSVLLSTVSAETGAAEGSCEIYKRRLQVCDQWVDNRTVFVD
jgi:predicted solute-binding protein